MKIAMKSMHLLVIMLLLVFASNATAERPNVVLILIDDISHFGVSAYGAESVSADGFFENAPIETPRIDSLAKDGLLCNYAYTYPLCENTRIALMSGQNNRRNFLNCKTQHASDITFGGLFQRAGYETCIVGKWKQTRGTMEIPGKNYIFEFGWDEFFCFDVINRVGRRMIEPNFVLNGEVKDYRGIDPETGRRWFGPELVNRYALDFIQRKQDQPFFLYYSMMMVHAEHTPTPDTKPASAYDEFDVDKPGKGRMKGDDRRFYPDMIGYTDKMVGQVLDKLDALGLAENTLVVVMGDNGSNPFQFTYPDGTVRIGGKGTHKDAGLRVPLLLRAPKSIPAGSTYDGLVYVTDILPMLCDAADVEIPNRQTIDGISFWPQATGQSTDEPRDAICTWYIGNNHVSKKEFVLEYAFDKRFKRYAPDAMFPEGRFFEWWNDVDEKAGAPVRKKVPKRWNKYRYAGLDVNELTKEQQAAYQRLGKLLDDNKYVSVKGLQIAGGNASVAAGHSLELRCEVSPANATRTGVIWETSDPDVATIDKFGLLSAHEAGEVTVNVYSWDDADPTSSNRDPTFFRTGITDSVTIKVTNANEKPNIIFMMLDDCSAVEFSCYATNEHPAAQETPDVDRLAEEGLRFETCWATPMCMPTRALLISGKYAYQTGQYGNYLRGAKPDFAKVHKPVSKVLQEHGYRTGISGKWHLPGFVYAPEYGWDEWSMLGGYIGPNDLNLVWDGPWFAWSNCTEYVHEKAVISKNHGKYPSLHWNGSVIENGKMLPSDAKTYAPDLNQQFALDFIERNKDRPFYLYYPCVLPHKPWMKTPEGPAGMESNVRMGVTYLKQLVDKLKETGVYDNTIVFFTADNATQGYGKGTPSELGVRVPLIVFGGPVKARGVTKALVDFADMYPTTLALAGIDPDSVPGLDGESFKPVLEGEQTEGRRFIFSYVDAFRTVRNRSYMMDGSGGIWKCASSGNILDYENITNRPEAKAVREHLVRLIEPYPAPTVGQFKKSLYKRGKKPKWPTADFGTMRYVKMGDDWMKQADRKEP